MKQPLAPIAAVLLIVGGPVAFVKGASEPPASAQAPRQALPA